MLAMMKKRIWPILLNHQVCRSCEPVGRLRMLKYDIFQT